MSLEKGLGHLINRKKKELEKGCCLFVLHERLKDVILDLHTFGFCMLCGKGRFMCSWQVPREDRLEWDCMERCAHLSKYF